MMAFMSTAKSELSVKKRLSGVYYTVVLYKHFRGGFLFLEDSVLTGNVCSI